MVYELYSNSQAHSGSNTSMPNIFFFVIFRAIFFFKCTSIKSNIPCGLQSYEQFR